MIIASKTSLLSIIKDFFLVQSSSNSSNKLIVETSIIHNYITQLIANPEIFKHSENIYRLILP